jgi:hypothetical protein
MKSRLCIRILCRNLTILNYLFKILFCYLKRLVRSLVYLPWGCDVIFWPMSHLVRFLAYPPPPPGEWHTFCMAPYMLCSIHWLIDICCTDFILICRQIIELDNVVGWTVNSGIQGDPKTVTKNGKLRNSCSIWNIWKIIWFLLWTVCDVPKLTFKNDIKIWIYRWKVRIALIIENVSCKGSVGVL